MVSIWTIVPGIIVSLIVLVITKLWDPIAQVYGYPFDVERRVKKLVEELEKLKAQCDELTPLDPKPSSPTLSGWMQWVDTSKRKVGEITNQYTTLVTAGEQRGLKGLLPWLNKVWHLCSIGRDADLELEIVKNLIGKGEDHLKEARAAPHPIPLPPPPSAAAFNNHQLAQSTLDRASAGTWGAGIQAMKSHLIRALDFVQDNDARAPGVLGVWGMGGSGKTTLLKLVQRSGLQTFDEVIFVEVGKCPDIAKLQDSIAQGTGLKFPPSFDVPNRATVISNDLQNKKFLLLLDDLWNYLDLEAVGIPSPLGLGNQRKVILTSRKMDVCTQIMRQMRCSEEHTISMGCLNQEDSWRLFEDKVGSSTINADSKIPELARQVASMCGGLPLALCVIGRSMCTKKNYKLWIDAVNRLKKSKVHNNLLFRDDEIFDILRYSFDELPDDEARGCFLACSLWSSCRRIKKNQLIRWSMGLGFLNYEKGFERWVSIIDFLQAASLLENVEEYFCIDMHDTIRDMASWIVNGPGGEKWSVLKRAWVQAATRRDEAEHRTYVEHWPPKDTWPELEMLAMESSNLDFMDHMGSCNDLLSTISFQNKNLSTIDQMPNITFLELGLTETFPMEICKLHKLEYLFIRKGFMKTLPMELGKLSKLKHLYLQQCNNLDDMPRGLISQLENLQVLDLSGDCADSCLVRPVFYNLLSELVCPGVAGNLKILGICLDGRSDNMAFLNQLKQKGVRIQSLSLSFIDYEPQYQLVIHYLSLQLQPFSNDLVELDISRSDNLRVLVVGSSDGREEMLQILEYFMLDNLYELETILLRNAGKNLREGHDREEPLQNLEYLRLDNHYELETIIWKNGGKNLREVYITKCEKLTHATWVLQLGCLEELEISHCPKFKWLIDHKKLGENPPDHVIFPRLKCLKIHYLPELCDICELPCEFKELSMFHVSNCKKMAGISFQHPPNIRILTYDDDWSDKALASLGFSTTYAHHQDQGIEEESEEELDPEAEQEEREKLMERELEADEQEERGKLEGNVELVG